MNCPMPRQFPISHVYTYISLKKMPIILMEFSTIHSSLLNSILDFDIQINETGVQTLSMQKLFQKPIVLRWKYRLGMFYDQWNPAKHAVINTVNWPGADYTRNDGNTLVILHIGTGATPPNFISINDIGVPRVTAFFTEPVLYEEILVGNHPGDFEITVDVVSNLLGDDPLKETIRVPVQVVTMAAICQLIFALASGVEVVIVLFI